MARRVRVRIERGTFAAIFAASGVLVALACSGSEAGGSSVLPEESCERGAADCAGAGSACASNAECAAGSCVAGQCIASPVTGTGGSGPSVPESGVGGLLLTDDYQPAAGGAPSVCADLEVDFDRVTPTVVLLIDRSGSMTEPFDDGRNRWQTLVQTLTDQQSSLIKKLEGSVRFGMALYTSNGGFGRNGNSTCPILTNVDISLGNFSNIRGLCRALRTVRAAIHQPPRASRRSRRIWPQFGRGRAQVHHPRDRRRAGHM